MNAADQYKPADVSHNDLLKYHLHVSNKVDNEIALREAKRTVALLDNPPTHEPHQHAAISHDAQKTPVNNNNMAVINRIKKEQKVVVEEKRAAKAKVVPEYKVLSHEEVAKFIKDMEKQVATASARTEPVGTHAAPKAEAKGKSKPAASTPTASSTAPAPPWLAKE